MNKEEIRKNIHELIEKFFSGQNSPFIPGQTFIGVSFPCYDHHEVSSAVDTLLDLRLSQGPKVKEFEQGFSRYIGTDFGVAVNSGSSANLLALAALLRNNVIKKGSEVILPAATFATVVSPVLQSGLIPVFVDVDEETYNISPQAIEKAINKNTGLIMVVHSLGCPANIEEIMAIANKKGIPVMEDCCEAHGTTVHHKKVGSFSLLSTFSFFVAHNITSGEGGMVLTNDKALNKTLRSLREFGRLMEHPPNSPRFYYSDEHLKEYDERYVFDNIGYNVRMTDIHASLGIEQLKKIDALNEIRIRNAAHYTKALSKYSQYLQLPKIPGGALHSFYTYPIIIKENAPFNRTKLVRYLEDHKIETRAIMGGDLSKQPAFRSENIKIADDLKNTKRVLTHGFFIGCHPKIDQQQLTYITSVFDNFFKNEI